MARREAIARILRRDRPCFGARNRPNSALAGRLLESGCAKKHSCRLACGGDTSAIRQAVRYRNGWPILGSEPNGFEATSPAQYRRSRMDWGLVGVQTGTRDEATK